MLLYLFLFSDQSAVGSRRQVRCCRGHELGDLPDDSLDNLPALLSSSGLSARGSQDCFGWFAAGEQQVHVHLLYVVLITQKNSQVEFF